MSNLTRDAEDYLAKLAKALWQLTPQERSTILLELRGHFADRQAQGRLHLLSTLDHMGPADAIAREFVEAAGRQWHSMPANENGKNLPAVVVRSNVPVAYKPRRELLPVRRIIEESLQTYAAARNGIWSICAVLIPCFIALNFVAGLQRINADMDSAPLWTFMAVRGVLIVAALVAAYRALLTQDDQIWAVSGSTVKFAGAALGMLATGWFLFLGFAAAADSALGLASGSWMRTGVDIAGGCAIATLLASAYLRIQPWAVGLAIEDPKASFIASLIGTAGRWRALITGWLIFVVPLLLIASVVNAATRGVPDGLFVNYGLALCMLDAVTSTALVLAIAMLNVIAFRWALDHPIPEAAPFSTRGGTAEEISRIRETMIEMLKDKRGNGSPRTFAA
jgi:hypothetical protein